jgi:hypothetical protein
MGTIIGEKEEEKKVVWKKFSLASMTSCERRING